MSALWNRGDRVRDVKAAGYGTVVDYDAHDQMVIVVLDDSRSRWRFSPDRLRKLSLLELMAEAAQ